MDMSTDRCGEMCTDVHLDLSVDIGMHLCAELSRYTVMAYLLMAEIVMAYIIMTYIVMALYRYIVMAPWTCVRSSAGMPNTRGVASTLPACGCVA